VIHGVGVAPPLLDVLVMLHGAWVLPVYHPVDDHESPPDETVFSHRLPVEGGAGGVVEALSPVVRRDVLLVEPDCFLEPRFLSIRLGNENVVRGLFGHQGKHTNDHEEGHYQQVFHSKMVLGLRIKSNKNSPCESYTSYIRFLAIKKSCNSG